MLGWIQTILIGLNKSLYGLNAAGGGASSHSGKTTFAATTASAASFNLPSGTAPSAPADGDVWREDNTDTGLKIRINGATKTITVS